MKTKENAYAILKWTGTVVEELKSSDESIDLLRLGKGTQVDDRVLNALLVRLQVPGEFQPAVKMNLITLWEEANNLTTLQQFKAYSARAETQLGEYFNTLDDGASKPTPTEGLLRGCLWEIRVAKRNSAFGKKNES